MSKELRAFRKICKNLNSYEFTDEYKKNKKLIETTLKENETLKECYKNELNNTAYYNNLALKYKRALEIIKEKGICLFLLENSENADDYNDRIDYFRGCDGYLTQKEYDILKEVFK